MESLEIAGGCRRDLVERTNTMDLTTVDPVIQEPDAGVVSDSMKAHPISTIHDFYFLCGGDAAFADDPDRPGLRREANLGDLSIGNRENK